MNIGSILFYILLVCVAVLTIFISFRLYQKYRQRFLLFYLYSFIFAYANGFIDIIGKYMARNALEVQATASGTIMVISLVFNYLAIPFIIIGWYMFILFSREFVGKKVPLVVKAGYFILQGTMFVTFGIIIANFVSQQLEQLSYFTNEILSLFTIISKAIIYIAVLHMLFNARELADKPMGKIVKNFGFIFLIFYTVEFLINYRILFANIVYYLYPLMSFSLNLPALVYLKYALDNYYKEHPLQPEKGVDLDRFFSQHNISKREQEIIYLILKGKSNRDIEDELYISLRTVKNHIYNIYKKLGVKSRWQLINMIRNFQGGWHPRPIIAPEVVKDIGK